jgi:hypothetical protein
MKTDTIVLVMFRDGDRKTESLLLEVFFSVGDVSLDENTIYFDSTVCGELPRLQSSTETISRFSFFA